MSGRASSRQNPAASLEAGQGYNFLTAGTRCKKGISDAIPKNVYIYIYDRDTFRVYLTSCLN